MRTYQLHIITRNSFVDFVNELAHTLAKMSKWPNCAIISHDITQVLRMREDVLTTEFIATIVYWDMSTESNEQD